MITSLVAILGLAVAVEEPIHPAFTLSKESFEAVWNRGFKEGQKKRDAKSAMDKFSRQIDSFHTGPISKSACSWATLIHPRLQIYLKANRAGIQYWPEEDTKKAKEEMSHFADSEQQYVGFYIDINEMPSFAAPYGRLSRYADPENLKDVRCILKVGDRIIQPTKQPGDLTVSKSDGVSFYSVPSTTYVRGTTNSSASAYGSGGYANAYGTSTSSYTITKYNTGEDSYSTYHGEFIVLFPTRDKDGNPLIKPTDKDVEIKVVKKSGEIKTTFRLQDWIKTFE